MLVADKKKVVFINGGKHFWNREKEIIQNLSKYFNIYLIINHSIDKNYNLSDIKEFCTNNRIQCQIIDYVNRKASNPLNIFRDFVNSIRILKIKPDLIYIESFGSPYFALFASFLFKSKKTIIAILDYKLHPYGVNHKKFSEKYYRFFYLNFFLNYHLFSYQQAEEMKRDFPLKNIRCIRLNLIGKDYKKITNDKGKDFTEFLFFGKIYYYKGVDILIKAATILSERTNKFHITIAGSCNDENYYKSLITKMDLFSLKFHTLDKDEISMVYSNADYFVAPYREVTQSGPLMIAFSFNIVPIVSDQQGFLEHVSNDRGFIFKTSSPEELADTMEKAINMSEQQKSILKSNLKKYVDSEFNLENITGKYLELFNNVINDNA